jgi:hypothetical protein
MGLSYKAKNSFKIFNKYINNLFRNRYISLHQLYSSTTILYTKALINKLQETGMSCGEEYN